MAQKSNLTESPENRISAAKPMLIGAAIGLMLISIFVFGVDDPNPEWGKFWRIRPLIITPLAGAMGGLFFYFMNYLGSRGSFNRTLAIVVGVVVFIIGLWLGIVLGLDGTMWN